MTPARIAPGATIGLLGGGQLGRMTALVARTMGYNVRVLDPDPDCPARPLADELIVASFDDVEAVVRLAKRSDVLTLEIERIAPAALTAAAAHAPVRPGAAVLATINDRANQKAWLTAQQAPVGAYRIATSASECSAAVAALGPSFVKAATGGFDGRGQVHVDRPDAAPAAWAALEATRCVVEQALALTAEISVLVARRPGGESVVYPVALNHHEAGQLAWSMLPAPIPDSLAAQATTLGTRLAAALDVVGLLAVEMFVVGDRLFVNEMAPRPHNSFHHTIEGCVTSQFEQLVRAVCNLPLGSPAIVRPAAIANILGDAWRPGRPPDFAAALGLENVHLHLYGKREPRAKRKMGHLAATADDAESARTIVLAAARKL
ncbi:MAG TPA: 5-(carboxyamino)imidazole ribonucleotide synthase [Gemmatimonadaceae bacterium]|nr:5-(carboxyamino)imidazole ribonucleotide synthase [Gemmatimonadaceae bacterium]